MSSYRVIKGAVSTPDGMVNVGGAIESSPSDAQHLIDNGFVELVPELASPVSAPSVEVVAEPAPVAKPVVDAPRAAVKGKK